jgi:hypothetical protein
LRAFGKINGWKKILSALTVRDGERITQATVEDHARCTGN